MVWLSTEIHDDLRHLVVLKFALTKRDVGYVPECSDGFHGIFGV